MSGSLWGWPRQPAQERPTCLLGRGWPKGRGTGVPAQLRGQEEGVTKSAVCHQGLPAWVTGDSKENGAEGRISIHPSSQTRHEAEPQGLPRPGHLHFPLESCSIGNWLLQAQSLVPTGALYPLQNPRGMGSRAHRGVPSSPRHTHQQSVLHLRPSLRGGSWPATVAFALSSVIYRVKQMPNSPTEGKEPYIISNSRINSRGI